MKLEQKYSLKFPLKTFNVFDSIFYSICKILKSASIQSQNLVVDVDDLDLHYLFGEIYNLGDYAQKAKEGLKDLLKNQLKVDINTVKPLFELLQLLRKRIGTLVQLKCGGKENNLYTQIKNILPLRQDKKVEYAWLEIERKESFKEKYTKEKEEIAEILRSNSYKNLLNQFIAKKQNKIKQLKKLLEKIKQIHHEEKTNEEIIKKREVELLEIITDQNSDYLEPKIFENQI
ncbi:hypothetical protein EDEG_05089 [Edhazardia aedis USNM 41457]|uniref:Uncharacterized protein n=1 Tax=Edhazardia aedis (strain USNM 41457) TaxID=1003232 RepID=A0A0L1P641_EDHAE|nr:hypothetical protein EDEG_05089 [Edhazardia aedis USNM 41457]|eukprot:KNH48528.1 hypothetical protein EDEG_05089 [Edhazardia aedis USNM 41457]